MPCWFIDEKTHPFVGVNIRILLQLQGETCLSNTVGDKGYPSLKPQLSQQPCEKD
jgi:hypothetical protein